jgi:hypothetical protein
MCTRRTTSMKGAPIAGLVLVALLSASSTAQTSVREVASAGSCAEQRIGTRRGHAMTYDPLSQGVVLFGGTSGDARDAEPRSLWSWDGVRWRCLSAEGPPGRDAPELAFDAARRKLVLYGGRTRGADGRFRVLTDTWEWDGSRWFQVDTVGPRPRRLHQVLAYDSSRRAVLLHGGLNAEDRLSSLSDTWLWTGARWVEVPLATPALDVIGHNALMSTADGVLLFAHVRDTTRCPPSGRWQRGHSKLFQLRGGTWAVVASDGPCGAGLPPTGLTADGVVLVNGSPPGSPWPAEAWQWSNGAWKQLDSMPTGRRAARAAYDPVRRRLVFFGGDNSAGMLGDTWEWDGQRWNIR